MDRLRQAAYRESGERQLGWELRAEAYQEWFIEAMDDDFNTAQALAILFDLATDINRTSEEGYAVAPAQQALLELASILGLTFKEPERPPLNTAALRQIAGSITERLEKAGQSQLSKDFRTNATIFSLGSNTESLLKLFISTREQLREAKQWQLADEIRAKLDEAGIVLEDTPKGTVWKRKR
ncbi:Cysteine--tRNA ligase [subsurface metagenome]